MIKAGVMNFLLITGLTGLFFPSQGDAQADASHPAFYEGCVGKLPRLSRYVLASGERCMLLAGDFKAAAIADHQVVLKGLLVEASGMMPLTLEVKSTEAVKEACSKTCTLEPPGTRGVHGREKPGPEGGSPGERKTPPPPAP